MIYIYYLYIYIFIYIYVCVHSLHYDIFTIKIDDGSWMYYDLTNKMISKAPVGYCALGAKRNDRASIRRCRSFNMVQHVYIHTGSIACDEA